MKNQMFASLALERKVPHYKIRIRRAFSRARMLHAHHHTHRLHNGPVVLLLQLVVIHYASFLFNFPSRFARKRSVASAAADEGVGGDTRRGTNYCAYQSARCGGESSFGLSLSQ